jgi:hypothetical protein
MISKEEYKKAQEVIKKYEQEQLDIPVVSNSSKPRKTKKETKVTPYSEWCKVLRNL